MCILYCRYDKLESEMGADVVKGLIRDGKFGVIREWLRGMCIYMGVYLSV